jgi:hypothetical protein
MWNDLSDSVKVFLIAAGGIGAWPLYKNVLKPLGRTLIRAMVRDYLNKEYCKQQDFNELAAGFDEFKDEVNALSHYHNDQLKARVADLATQMQNFLARVVEIETKVAVFWKMIEKSTADLLHRDDTPNIDRLLEKLPAENLTDPERRELLGYLEKIEKGEGEERHRPEGRRTGAALLRASIVSRFYADEYE